MRFKFLMAIALGVLCFLLGGGDALAACKGGGFFHRLRERRQQRMDGAQGVATAQGASCSCEGCPGFANPGFAGPAPQAMPGCPDGKCPLPSATLQLPKPPATLPALPKK